MLPNLIKTTVCFLGAASGLASCVASQRNALPTFAYNAHSHNNLITSKRIFQYGDGRPDGCIMETPISLALVAAPGDSIVGFAYETGTAKAAAFATVQLFVPDSVKPVVLVASQMGRFAFSRTRRVQRINISLIGCQPLSIELASQKLF